MGLSPDPLLLIQRRTRIVVTLGPASSDARSIARLIAAGVNVFRLNMSHGERAEHRETVHRIRTAAAAADVHVGVLVDLSGPKIRVGRFRDGGIDLPTGSKVTVTTRAVIGVPGLIPSQYAALATDVRPGDRILLDDGHLELRADRRAAAGDDAAAGDGDDILCTVVHGGRLTDHKGMNLPDGELSIAALTDKDREDAQFAVDESADFLALSFVRQAADIQQLRELLPPVDKPWIIAKIERPEALDNAEAIFAASDAIMVARGDLGIELPFESVPGTQDDLVSLARRHHKPVIIATQMLDSMIRNPRPTRAEVADIAHAVTSGADGLMLSGETAIGRHPFEAVATMDRVIRHTEARLWSESAFFSLTDPDTAKRPMPLEDAFGLTVSRLSRDLAVRTILVISRSGTSGRMLSSSRPAAPVLAATARERTCRRLNLCWGVVPVKVGAAELQEAVPLLRRLVQEIGLAATGQHGLIVQGFLTDARESRPTVTVVTI